MSYAKSPNPGRDPSAHLYHLPYLGHADDFSLWAGEMAEHFEEQEHYWAAYFETPGGGNDE